MRGRVLLFGPRSPANVCRTKTEVFRSPAKARDRIKLIRSKGGPKYWYHFCEHCGGYHLTRQNRGKV